MEQGARHLVLTGRRSPNDATLTTITELEQRGAQVVVQQGDISQAEHVQAVLETISQNMPPLRGIIHSAGALEDAALVRQDWERFSVPLRPAKWMAHGFYTV